jgi:hypothetical protein
MQANRISATTYIRTIIAAFGWALVGAALIAPLTLVAGFFYAIVCALLYAKTVAWGAVALHWVLVGIAAGGLMGFYGRVIDDENPLAPEFDWRHAVPATRRRPFASIAGNLLARVTIVRRHTRADG